MTLREQVEALPVMGSFYDTAHPNRPRHTICREDVFAILSAPEPSREKLREKVAQWVMKDQDYSGEPTEWMYRKADDILTLFSAHEGFYETLWKDFCSLQRGDAQGIVARVEQYYRGQAALPETDIAEATLPLMPTSKRTVTLPDEGYWPANDLRRAFVRGAKWWEFFATKGTMWQSDRDKAEVEAEKRYPGGKNLDEELRKVQRAAYVLGREKSFAQGNQGLLSEYMARAIVEADELYPDPDAALSPAPAKPPASDAGSTGGVVTIVASGDSTNPPAPERCTNCGCPIYHRRTDAELLLVWGRGETPRNDGGIY